MPKYKEGKKIKWNKFQYIIWFSLPLSRFVCYGEEKKKKSRSVESKTVWPNACFTCDCDCGCVCVYVCMWLCMFNSHWKWLLWLILHNERTSKQANKHNTDSETHEQYKILCIKTKQVNEWTYKRTNDQVKKNVS